MTNENESSSKPTDPTKTTTAQKKFGEGAVSGATVIMVSKILSMAITMVTIAIIARILTPEDYGLVAMVLSVSAFFMLFSDFGLSLVTVQRPKITQEQLSTLFWINVAFGLLLGLILAALSPVIAWFYQEPRLSSVALVLSITFPLIALSVQHQALLKREMKFPRLAFVRLCGTLGGGIISVSAALTGWGYWSLVFQPLASALIQLIVIIIVYPWKPGLPRRCDDLRNMLIFGGSLTGHGLVGYFSNNLDKLLLGRFAGTYALGLYAISYNLMMRAIGLAGYSVGEAAIPAMSRKSEFPDQQRAVFRRMFTLTALWGFPTCLAGVFWSGDLVFTLLGDQWVDAIDIMRILFVAAIARMITTSTGWVYVSTSRPGRMFKWQIIWSIIVTIAIVIGLSRGATGVAIAYTIANWIALVPAFAFCFSKTHFTAKDVLQPAVTPMICALTACVISIVVQKMIFPDLTAGPARLIIRFALAALIYVPTTIKFVPLAAEAYTIVLNRMKPLFYKTNSLPKPIDPPRIDGKDL